MGGTGGLQVGEPLEHRCRGWLKTWCLCRRVVGWLSDCVWVGPSVLGEARGAQIGGFLRVLTLSCVARGGVVLYFPPVGSFLVPKSLCSG